MNITKVLVDSIQILIHPYQGGRRETCWGRLGRFRHELNQLHGMVIGRQAAARKALDRGRP